jgi:hypothetical protein
VRLRIIYHNISVGLCTNQHFLRHCLEWILDLFFGSCVKKFNSAEMGQLLSCSGHACKTEKNDIISICKDVLNLKKL